MKRTFTILTRPTEYGPLYAAGFSEKGSELTVSQWTHSLPKAFRAANEANENPALLAQLRNVRFWEFINCGWVRITLRPGQKLAWHRSSNDDEGYSHCSESWEHEGTRVIHQWGEDCSDCDGRMTTGGESTCSMDRLATVPGYNAPEILRPDWKKVSSDQRDYAAEAAGY